VIIFDEKAFAKVLFFRDNCIEKNVQGGGEKSESFLEVSLMGISKNSEDDIHRVVDVLCVPQECTGGNTEFLEKEYTDWREARMFDDKMDPITFSRIWIHTHPGESPNPSNVDEDNFKKIKEDADFACMYIVAKKNKDYCRTMYDSRLGQKQTLESAKVIVGNWIVPTSYIFDLEEAAQQYNISYIEESFLSQYKAFHDNWLKELKECVRKKQYNHNIGTGRVVGHYQPNSHNAGYYPISNGATIPEAEDKKEIISRRIALRLLTEKKCQLNKADYKYFDTLYSHPKNEVVRMFRNMTNIESKFDDHDCSIIMDDHPEVYRGLKCVFNELTPLKQSYICGKYKVRPNFLQKALEQYIKEVQELGYEGVV